MRKSLITWLLAGIIVLISNQALAYWVNVHRHITNEVIEQNVGKVDGWIETFIGLSGVDAYINGQKIRKWIIDGSEREDDFFSPLVTARYMNHFYNPLNNSGLADSPFFGMASSYEWGSNHSYNSWTWKQARDHFYYGLTKNAKADRDNALANSFRALGQVMHLVQDLAVPAHVRNDAHPTGDPYEAYTNSNLDALDYSLVPFPYWNVSLSPYAPKQFWDLESYNGSTAYDSGYIGLAEYTAANFYSKDTIGMETVYPHPSRQNTNLQDFDLLPTVVIATPDNITHTVFNITGYGKERLAALKYFGQEILELPGGDVLMRYKLSLFLDNECHKEYAKFLIPRAVGYSAGLLNYFFRGQIDMVSDPSNPGKYLIKNLSNETMSGTFSLYYDDKNDNRILITSWENLSINANSQSAPVTFTEPASPEPKEKGKYILIFRGTQGSEADAVAGKVVTIKGEVNGRMVVLYDILTPSVTVKTKTGPLRTSLPTDGFWNAISVRFDVDDPDTFVVLALHYDCTSNSCSGRYDFHKFFIDETKKIVSYQGVALSIPIPKENVTQSNICSYNEDWSDKCGTKRRFTTQTNVEPLEVWDFYIKGGAITPYGGFSEVERTRFHDCWDIWYKTANGGCQRGIERPYTSCGYPSELEGAETRGIYFGSPVVSTTHSWAGGFVDVSRGCFSVDVRSAHIPQMEVYQPVAIFNDSDYAYWTALQTNYYYGWTKDWQLKTTLPIQMPQSRSIAIKTMLRKDGRYSFCTKDTSNTGSVPARSYASEIGVADCSCFLIGENNIGWHVEPWIAEIVQFNSCSDWKSLLSLGEGFGYNYGGWTIYDVILFYD